MTLANKECRSSTQFSYLEDKSGFRSVHTRFPACLQLWPSVEWHCAHSQTHNTIFKEEQAPAKVELTRIAFTSEDSLSNKLCPGTSGHLPPMTSDDAF